MYAEDTAGIYGVVSDGITGEPLVNALLVAWYSELGTSTYDSKNTFNLFIKYFVFISFK